MNLRTARTERGLSARSGRCRRRCPRVRSCAADCTPCGPQARAPGEVHGKIKGEGGPRGGWIVWLFVAALTVTVGVVRADELFERTNLMRLAIRVDAAGMDALRQRSDGAGERARARAEVSEGGRVYADVSVQLKGFSSFRPIDDRPSLTLKFNRHVRGQRFHGLEKISLNNSMQDSSRLNEVVARELFAAAGVPVPRATQVWVELNGRELGLYVLTEGLDERFLARIFGRADGVLYEGGTLRDIDARPRIAWGEEPFGEPSPLYRLIAAARKPDPAERYDELSRLLDLDRFLSMMAMETILCHSDSYTMNRNNYRVHYSPVSGRFTFIPHGLDRILGDHRSGLDLSIVPPQLGLVSRGLLSTAPGRRLYLARLETLATNLFRPRVIAERVRQLDSRLQAELQMPVPAQPQGAPFVRPGRRRLLHLDSRNGGANLCDRLERRSADLIAQLSTLPESLRAPGFPEFDPVGRCRISEWAERRSSGREVGTMLRTNLGNGPIYIVRSPAKANDVVSVTLVHRLTLPAGRYRLQGGWRVLSDRLPVEGTAYLQRSARERFQFRRDELDWRAMDEEVAVTASYAPEEIELVCEFRSAGPELRLDPGSIQIVTQR